MGRIRVLSDTIANQIAAGEVVERPASVVKELLENSLDAGASEVRIEVESGGRRMIRIFDDGIGMIRDDALLAFERHATSKLSKAADLLEIATLGFRGEALPSIASVSRLLLETRNEEESTGTRVEIAGGKLLQCDEVARTRGTTITVRDLFFNVPARKKFLRSDQTELAHIASLATHYSLAHFDKQFRLHHEGHELLRVSPVGAAADRLYQVFGAEVMADLLAVQRAETELALPPSYQASPAPGEADEEAEAPGRHYALSGFVSQPQVQKLNRNSIYLFVNGRLIKDRLLLHALSAAYHNLMPPACYPFALLFLECDPAEVDVNVHPSKTEVRFRHSSFVHDFVRDTVRQLLMRARPVASFPTMPAPSSPLVGSPQRGAQLPYSEFSQRLEESAWQSGDRVSTPTGPVEPMLHSPLGPSPRLDFGASQIVVPSTSEGTAVSRVRGPVPDTHGAPPDWALAITPSLDELTDLRVMGQLHESFIVAAGRDGLWIIDQHVAHERILFEQVLRQQAAGTVERQNLLLPQIVGLSASQWIQYERIAAELDGIGFTAEPFGGRSLALHAAPAGIGASDTELVLREVLDIADGELRGLSVADLRRDLAASIACRAAIKINMRLEPAKMAWLLEALACCEYPMACPHGRPIALRYPMRDILRGFHRI